MWYFISSVNIPCPRKLGFDCKNRHRFLPPPLVQSPPKPITNEESPGGDSATDVTSFVNRTRKTVFN